MEKYATNYALHVLDQQLSHMLTRRTAEQEAYYRGMRLMFDILISNGFESNACARSDDNGKHYISNE